MKRYIAATFTLLTIAVACTLLLVLESDFLWKVQEMNLFLNTSLFFREQMAAAGGLLTWLGTFFTQFLYHPWQGVLLLAAWWVLLAWLVKQTFQLKGLWCLLTVIPVLLILVTIVDMGYWVYILKLRGHFFLTTIATTAVTALLWLFRKVAARKVFSLLLPLLTCIAGYPLMGIYALAAVLLMSVWVWRAGTGSAPASGERRRGWTMVVSVVGVASVIIVPLLYYRFVFCQVNLVNIYYVSLPVYRLIEDYQQYYVPYYLLLLFYLVMVIVPPSQLLQGEGGQPLRRTGKGPAPKLTGWRRVRPYMSRLIPVLLVVVAIAYTATSWFRDGNYHRELAMEHCIERLDWEGVLRVAADQQDEPTRAIVMMRNLALARLGRQADEMYHYRNGSCHINAPFPMRMIVVNGSLVYYHYGLLNNCYRLCMEIGVEYGWRAEQLKYMARCSILNGETRAARKYLALLKNTTFFKEWATEMESVSPGQSPEMGFITHMMHYKDALLSDNGYVEQFIMNRLAKSTYGDDPVFQEQALLASLYTRDIRLFWRHLSNYGRLHPGAQLPIHVQEAAILFGSLEDRPGMESWPFDERVRASYRRFCEVTPRYDNMEVGPIRKALAPEFGHTYYYDYYLMSELPQY